MKSRASKLPPELQKLVQEAVDRQMKEERGYIVLLTLQLSLWVLAADPYGWGKKRLEQLFEREAEAFNYLTANYGMDCWHDKVISDLKRIGVTFEDDGWQELREAGRREVQAYDAQQREEALRYLAGRAKTRNE